MDREELKIWIGDLVCLPCVHIAKSGKCKEENCSLREKAVKGLLSAFDSATNSLTEERDRWITVASDNLDSETRQAELAGKAMEEIRRLREVVSAGIEAAYREKQEKLRLQGWLDRIGGPFKYLDTPRKRRYINKLYEHYFNSGAIAVQAIADYLDSEMPREEKKDKLRYLDFREDWPKHFKKAEPCPLCKGTGQKKHSWLGRRTWQVYTVYEPCPGCKGKK